MRPEPAPTGYTRPILQIIPLTAHSLTQFRGTSSPPIVLSRSFDMELLVGLAEVAVYVAAEGAAVAAYVLRVDADAHFEDLRTRGPCRPQIE